MREIKFRAWDGKRITTSGIMFNCSTGFLETPIGAQMKLMQFTGLKDKNGREIYEGDILDNKEAVVYSIKDACFYCGTTPLCMSNSHREIIGNIHAHKQQKHS